MSTSSVAVVQGTGVRQEWLCMLIVVSTDLLRGIEEGSVDKCYLELCRRGTSRWCLGDGRIALTGRFAEPSEM